MMPRSAGTTLAICAAAVWTAPAGAIDIQVTFNNGMSETYTLDGDDRTLDLIPIFEAAAARWAEFYLDAYTVQISYWWEDVPDPIARNFTDDGVGLITATIRINTIPSWWFDPTPFDDSEFSPMQPYLFRDLPASEQNEAFRNPASVPDLFEVSYVGEAIHNDLLTVVMHEIGHVLGLNNLHGPPECDDDYYDIPTGFTFGSPVGLRVFGNTSCLHLDLGGVEACLNCQALMWPGQNDNARTLPGAADILAIATAAGWTDVKLPRTYFLDVVGDYTEDAKWLGGVRPDMSVDVYVVNHPPTALIVNAGHGAARNLTIDGLNDIFMGGFRLSVIDTMRMTDPGVSVNLNDPASELEVNTLQIVNGAVLVLNAGLVDAEVIDNGAIIFGATIVDVGTILRNTGTIQANGGTLWLTTTNPGPVFDLDGFIDEPDAELIATTGSIGIIGNFVGSFVGTTTVGESQIFAFTDLLEFRGPVYLFGGGTDAVVNGPSKFGFESLLTVDKVGRFLSTVDFTSFAEVFVPQDDDILVLEGTTTYTGGDYLGAGEIHQVGDACFEGDTTIGPIGVYNWDGTGNSTTNISPGVTLTIDAVKIETGLFFDGFDGILNMLGSTLIVNTAGPWGFCGNALINVLAGAESTIDGSPMDCRGFLNLDGTVNFLCEIDIYADGELSTTDATTVANLTNLDNDLFGGLISGPGTLDVNTGASVFGFGTVETDLDNHGTFMAEDGILTVSGSIFNAGLIGCATNTSELVITQNWNNHQSGTVEVGGGTISGGSLFNVGTTFGEGFLVMPQYANRGLLSPGDVVGTLPGILLVSQDFVQFDDAILRVGIGGLNLGSEYDSMQIGGNNSLNGELHIERLNGFWPDPGDEFMIMFHASMDGAFDVIVGADIGNGLSFEVQYNPTDVRLVVIGTPCPGDLLPPMGVGIEDFLELLATWGQPNVPGDLLPPPGVGIEDFLKLLANWGPC